MTEATDDEAKVSLQFCVADAQGLRLKKGGEMRMIITIRALDDPDGILLGAKVTPWQSVPETQAPKWVARAAGFKIDTDRCFQAEFIDSAVLHIQLMQRGFIKPPEQQVTGQDDPNQGGWKGLFGTLSGAIPGMLEGASVERGEVIGILKMPLGRRLVCPGEGNHEGAQWVHLVEESGTKVRGSLLLELVTAHDVPPSSPPVAAPASRPVTPGSAADASEAVPVASPPESPSAAPSPTSPRDTSLPPSVEAEESDSASDGGNSSDVTPNGGMSSDSTSASRHDQGHERAPQEKAVLLARSAPIDSSFDSSRSTAVAATALPTPRRAADATPSKWLTVGQVRPDNFKAESASNIFTANHIPDRENTAEEWAVTRLFSKVSTKVSHATTPVRSAPVQEQIRSVFYPAVRQQRIEVQKWRQRHEVFCVLNSIDQRLLEVLNLLSQAASSMRRFKDSHSSLSDFMKVSSFLRDAALYYKSEASVPRLLEDHLAELESVADEFRGISADDTESRDEQSELWRACTDSQVDIAVLLESALMAAQQALAEYKKMHCRLELLVTEYEPVCRLELEERKQTDFVFLPLLTDEASIQVHIEASMPERAVQWALDFSQLVGAASLGLTRLVRSLEQRQRQLKNCSLELKEHSLRRAAMGEG